ncbi:MAG: aldehyde dehydrogenase family protein [Bdellovibrionota bacterium]
MNESIFPLESEIPQDVRVPRLQGRILIGGRILDSGFARRPVVSPCASRGADGTLIFPEIGETPNVDGAMFQAAADAAVRAWGKGRGEWATARMEERVAAVASFRTEMLRKRELIVRLLMWEIAKPKPDAEAEFDRTITYIDDTIEATKQLDRDCSRIQFAGGIMAQIRRAPLGVTLCMGPFNYPLNETFTTLIPALIVGNPVLVKIPRYGQLLWDPLLEAFRDCFPAGVVNVVNGLGREIIAPVVQSGKIDVLAFIGSSQVANKIKLSHPQPHHFRGILGLDAKNPALILEDADLENAVAECVRGTLSFNGQRCTALKVLFVPRKISRDFVSALVAKVDSLKCGLPWAPGVSITPLPDRKKPQDLLSFVEDAVKQGATLANPAKGAKIEGSLFHPAVVTGVRKISRLGCEEQFGPIIPVIEYDAVEEFIDYVVDSPFGMQASVFGRDPNHVGSVIDALSNQVCRINLNAQCQRGPDVFPFTGRKSSAEGTLSVTDALRSFSIRAMVATKQDASGKKLFKSILNGDDSRFLSTDIVL